MGKKAEVTSGKDNLNRAKWENFKKYMEENPIYFAERLSKISIREAYDHAMDLRRKMRAGKLNFFHTSHNQDDNTIYAIGASRRDKLSVMDELNDAVEV
jgi:hypothetical protein